MIAGPIRLSNSKLAGFDLGSKLSSISKLSGAKTGADTSIENLSTDARMSPDGVRTDKVNLTIPALGVLTGNGTVSPGGALNYQMTATLSGAAVTAVTQLVGLGDKGQSIPFFVRGTTSNPSFEPDVKGMLTGQVGSQIGGLLKSKLFGKSGQDSSPAQKSFTGQKSGGQKGSPPRSFAAQKNPQPAAAQKSSVMKKLTGWFHKGKKDQSTKK